MNSTLTIKNALEAEGIHAEATEVVKNSVTCTGWKLNIPGNNNISPVLYYSPDDESLPEFVERAKTFLDAPVPDFNIQDLLSREYLLEHTYLCVQRHSEEDLLKQNYHNIEIYLRIEVTCGTDLGSIKVTRSIINAAGVSEEELFAAARKNSLDRTIIRPISEVLGMPDVFPMYVGTYANLAHGAGILAVPEAFHQFAVSTGIQRCLVLPSSTEEVIIIDDDGADYAQLVSMVNEINDAEVDATLQLAPAVYAYDDFKRTISLVA